MITYIFEFDIVPGKADEFWSFMGKKGIPFWKQFPEVDDYKVYSKLGGRPLYEAHVELESFEVFNKIRSHKDWDSVAKEISKYAENMQRRFLCPVIISQLK